MKLEDKQWNELVQLARSDRPGALDESRLLAAYSSLRTQPSGDWLDELGRLFGRPSLQLGFGLSGLAALIAGLLLSYGIPETHTSDLWTESLAGLEVTAS